MNLKWVTIAFVFLTILRGAAQEANTEKATLQLGVDATSFINTFLSFNDNEAETGVHHFILKALKENKGFRMGLGFGIAKSSTKVQVNQEDRINKDNFINLRVGHEWQIPVMNKWLAYFGLDALGGFSLFESSFNGGFGEIITKNKSFHFGGGGVFGIQFNINKRISLATESSLYYSHVSLKSEVIFDNQPNPADETDATTDQLRFHLPTSLFFQVSF